jgi:class 3 adenylate cyclase
MSQIKAILFADISGSSALYKSSGNQSAKEIVDFLLDAMGLIVSNNNGLIIKSIGDEIMTCFEDCNSCLNAATEMQLKFNSILQQPELGLSVGIGFGEVICDKNDVFGEAVNDAAYLTHVAQGGQILLSESVFNLLDLKMKAKVSEFDRVIMKGANSESNIYRYAWQGGRVSDSETQLMSVEMVIQELGSAVLELNYNGEIITISSEQTPFYLGRDEHKCNLIVDAEQVSRQHCQIKFSRGKFVLVDHSTNGCYITTANKGEMYIRREEYPLIGDASLSLGIRSEMAPFDIIDLSLSVNIKK